MSHRVWHFTKEDFVTIFSFFFFSGEKEKNEAKSVSQLRVSQVWVVFDSTFPHHTPNPTQILSPLSSKCVPRPTSSFTSATATQVQEATVPLQHNSTASTWYSWEHPTPRLSSIHPTTREIFPKCESDHGSLPFTNPHGLPGPSRVLVTCPCLYFLLHLPQLFPDSLHFSQIGFLSVL